MPGMRLVPPDDETKSPDDPRAGIGAGIGMRPFKRRHYRRYYRRRPYQNLPKRIKNIEETGPERTKINYKERDWKTWRQIEPKGRQVFDEDLGPVVKTIPYKRNTFVMFANNSTNTVHSVSKRISPTTYRRSVNIIGEFKRGFAKMYEVQEIR